MFRTVPLSIIRSFSLYTQQWYMSYRFTDIYIALFCKTKYTLCYIKAVFESMERPSGHCNSAGPQDFQSLCKGPPHVVICALNTQHNTTQQVDKTFVCFIKQHWTRGFCCQGGSWISALLMLTSLKRMQYDNHGTRKFIESWRKKINRYH